MSYAGLKNAIETGEGLEGTIEFFPEEGNTISTDTGNATSV